MGVYNFECECGYKQDVFVPLKGRDKSRTCPNCGELKLNYKFDNKNEYYYRNIILSSLFKIMLFSMQQLYI